METAASEIGNYKPGEKFSRNSHIRKNTLNVNRYKADIL